MTFPSKTGALKVPGASIYYETKGSGPLVLLIPGGPTDAGIFAELSAHLADRYTVVAYDPRGNSRSTLDGQPEDQNLDTHGDDAAQLIKTLGNGPAFILGSSGGAQIGLNLAARHPGLVHTLVAHEPPCLMLLPDPSEALAGNRAIHDTYRRDGVEAAMQKFMAMAGLDEDGAEEAPQSPPPPEALETFGRINGNVGHFLAHGLMPLSQYQPDVDALRAGSPRIVIGVGEETAGQIAHRTGVALAEKLGTEPLHFPGDHSGYRQHAENFAKILHQTFAQG